jgi:hypothetical protein
LQNWHAHARPATKNCNLHAAPLPERVKNGTLKLNFRFAEMSRVSLLFSRTACAIRKPVFSNRIPLLDLTQPGRLKARTCKNLSTLPNDFAGIFVASMRGLATARQSKNHPWQICTTKKRFRLSAPACTKPTGRILPWTRALAQLKLWE